MMSDGVIFMHRLGYLSTVLIIHCCWLYRCCNGAGEGPQLPIFPPSLQELNFSKSAYVAKEGRKIPKILWIAVVNKTEVAAWEHIVREQTLNPGWQVNLWDNADKDAFMAKHFAGTSLLWAYDNINPVVGGAAKADIWRYAALYIHGGVYIDSDSALTKPIDDMIRDDDEFVTTFERNHFDGDWCYSPNSRHSTIYNMKKHPLTATMDLFHGNNILNWCIISTPYHIFLRRTLENFVKLMRLEYLGLSELKMAKYDNFSKHVYCTTGPSMFTASCRELLVELEEMARKKRGKEEKGNESANTSGDAGSGSPPDVPMFVNGEFPVTTKYRLGSRDFVQEGAVFKAINNHKGDKHHYTKASMDNKFMLKYATEEESKLAIKRLVTTNPLMQGALIMGRFKKSVYYLDKGTIRPIGGMDVFNAMNLSLSDITHYSDFVIEQLPVGPQLG